LLGEIFFHEKPFGFRHFPKIIAKEKIKSQKKKAFPGRSYFDSLSRSLIIWKRRLEPLGAIGGLARLGSRTVSKLRGSFLKVFEP
jgi:hypothetical protein